MKILTMTLGLAMAAATVAPAFAQAPAAPKVPPNNASTTGTEGPNSNSAGLPSASNPGVSTTTVIPSANGQAPAAAVKQ